MMHLHRFRSGLIGIVALMTMGVTACTSGTSPETTAVGHEAVSSTTSASGSPETTVAVTTTAAPAVGWVRVADEAGALGGDERQSINAVTAGGPGVVAVGTDAFDAGAVWTSPDGLTWTRIPDDEAIFSEYLSTTMNAVTAGGPGIVAVGGNINGAVVWTSTDGNAWSLVSDEAALGGGQQMRGVITTDSGLIAVGETYTPEASTGATVWTSPDGLSWIRLPDTVDTHPADTDASMSAIVSGGSGFVAVGHTYGDDEDAAVWTSPDGLTWTRVPDDGTLFGGSGNQSMRAVTAGGTGLVAVGYDDATSDVGAAVWTSPDGLTWTRVPSALETFGGVEASGLRGVVTDGSGFVAVGSVGSGSAIWTSPDGAVWTPVPQNDGDFDKDRGVMMGISHGGPGLIAVGQAHANSDTDAAVWVEATSD